MDFIGKKYKLKSSENFDEFLKRLGVGLFARKTANSLYPITELILNDTGSYTLVLATLIRTTRITFRPGVPFEEERADGVKVTSMVTMEGNVIIQIQRDAQGKTATFVREFGPKELKVTNTIDGWDGVCIRIYEAMD